MLTVRHSYRMHHCTAARDHSPLTKKVMLVGNGGIVFVCRQCFLRVQDVFKLRGVCLILIADFLSFLGNHSGKESFSSKVTDVLVIPMQERKQRNTRHLQ